MSTTSPGAASAAPTAASTTLTSPFSGLLLDQSQELVAVLVAILLGLPRLFQRLDELLGHGHLFLAHAELFDRLVRQVEIVRLAQLVRVAQQIEQAGSRRRPGIRAARYCLVRITTLAIATCPVLLERLAQQHVPFAPALQRREVVRLVEVRRVDVVLA